MEIQGSYLLFTCEDDSQVLQEERMLAQSGALRVADSWSVRRNKDSPYWIPERWTSNWQLYQAIFIFTTLDSSRPHRDSNWRIRIFLYDFDWNNFLVCFVDLLKWCKSTICQLTYQIQSSLDPAPQSQSWRECFCCTLRKPPPLHGQFWLMSPRTSVHFLGQTY